MWMWCVYWNAAHMCLCAWASVFVHSVQASNCRCFVDSAIMHICVCIFLHSTQYCDTATHASVCVHSAQDCNTATHACVFVHSAQYCNTATNMHVFCTLCHSVQASYCVAQCVLCILWYCIHAQVFLYTLLNNQYCNTATHACLFVHSAQHCISFCTLCSLCSGIWQLRGHPPQACPRHLAILCRFISDLKTQDFFW